MRPQDSMTREMKQITGLWDFCFDPQDQGVADKYYAGKLPGAVKMSVGNSYNDIFTDRALHDYVGAVWYQTTVKVPAGWKDQRITLYFESVTHQATVWVDEALAVTHAGGYTPFEADLTDSVTPGKNIRITVRVSNVLTFGTIPPGVVVETAAGKRQKYWHDFFNYAGIHRPVWLAATPKPHIQYVQLTTTFSGADGYVTYTVQTSQDAPVAVEILDAEGKRVASGAGASGTITIPDVTLWKPGCGYLYTARCCIGDPAAPRDEYRQRFGVRTVKIDGQQFLINGEPFYFKGFGMHEDIQVIGKGHNDANMLHDFELLDWIGANSFRTSHYPYSEDVMDYADEKGIVVIDECAAVGLRLITDSLFPGLNFPRTFSDETINEKTGDVHAQAIRELVHRDFNHPSVVMWSIANEPASHQEGADTYFAPLFALARELDPTRPIVFANEGMGTPENCKLMQFSDAILLNRYFGWYTYTANLADAERMLRAELEGWSAKNKPIIFTEYGADTVSGMHSVNNAMWSEEFQTAMLDMYHKVFDEFDAVVGEQVWNFADFATEQGILRVGGNKKGVFNRDRTPKAAAFYLRKRWKGEA